MAVATALRSSNNSLQRQVSRRDAKIEKLKEKLAVLAKQAFGNKSDRLDTAPAPTEEEEAALLAKQKEETKKDDQKGKPDGNKPNAAASDKPKRRKKKSKGRRPRRHGKNIEVEDQFHGPKTCPCGCGGSRRDGKPYEEVIGVPAKQIRVRHHFPVYRCRFEGKLVPFIRERRLYAKKQIGASTIAYFAALKFDWFMPTYRQERILRQEGVFVHRSTISRNLNTLALDLEPIADEVYENLVSFSAVLHADDTVHYRLVNGNGKVKKICLTSIVRDERGFGGHRPPAAYYRVYPSASQATYEDLFAGRELIVTHDGHGSFNKFGVPGTPLAGITPTGCWSHVRRYFVEAHNIGKSKTAKILVREIDRVFELERRMSGSSARVRLRVRRRCSKPVLANFYRLIDGLHADYPQDGRMARAINYVKRRWDQLTMFLTDGHIEMHNNSVQRSFKSPILLRNAALFSASEEGEKAWAIIFTLSETCRLNGVNFYRYLLWVMNEIAQLGDNVDYALLLPWNAPDHCFTAVDEYQPPPINLPQDPYLN